jgi:GNAT superfamily N-acetyltransferase
MLKPTMLGTLSQLQAYELLTTHLDQRRHLGKEDLALRIEMAHLKIRTNFMASYARDAQGALKVVSMADGVALVGDLEARFVPGADGDRGYQISPRVLDEVEARCRGHSASLSIELDSASDPSMIWLLAARGYRLEMPADVLVCPVMPVASRVDAEDITVERAGPDELRTWAQVLADGFEEAEPEAAVRYSLACGLSSCAMPLLARLRCGFAGAGLPALHDRVGWLFDFSTIPAARRRGVQSALIATALEILLNSGCDVAAAEAAVDTSSHRNFQRLGFEVLYRRWDFTKHLH